MYRIVHSSALVLCTHAGLVSGNLVLEISIALATSGNNEDSKNSVDKNSSKTFCVCVLAIAASK